MKKINVALISPVLAQGAMQGDCPEEHINTAVGCIPIGSTTGMAEFMLRWGIGIASGVFFILTIYAGFILMTSTGDPKRIQAGRELMTSAIGGMIFLVFSVFILRLVGVDILHIPGWGV